VRESGWNISAKPMSQIVLNADAPADELVNINKVLH